MHNASGLSLDQTHLTESIVRVNLNSINCDWVCKMVYVVLYYDKQVTSYHIFSDKIYVRFACAMLDKRRPYACI